MTKGKCPYCGKEIDSVNVAYIDGKPKTIWRLISFSCPLCSKLISVSMDLEQALCATASLLKEGLKLHGGT
jgi:hypothetical protein